MLKAEKLSYGPPGMDPLQENLNFSLNPGQVLHLTGANGSGKSLLTRVLLGLHPAREGSIQRSYVSARYLPQMQNRSAHLPYALADVVAAKEEDALKLGLLERERLSLGWNRASGGERQKALLTRVFCQQGDLLVLDEPFNHLDSRSKSQVKLLIKRELESEIKPGVLLISHDDDPAAWLKGIPVLSFHLSAPEDY